MAIARQYFKNTTASVYDDVRTKIKSGDLLLCSGQRPFSKAIQVATRSIWSHVAFILRLDSVDRVMARSRRSQHAFFAARSGRSSTGRSRRTPELIYSEYAARCYGAIGVTIT
jgi:hypothetical protein